jgi:MinD-like ATPase involved in chromosome partitioning or flagellar assembly
MALGPLRQWATVPVVGIEGGAGRTTVTYLIGQAFMTVRKARVAAVDAVPLWGGLTSGAEGSDGLTVRDVAAMTWPPPAPVEQLLEEGLAPSGQLPIVISSAPRGLGRVDPDTVDLAVRRVSALVALTLIDTVADVLSSPTRQLIMSARTTPVRVCTATRDGLWGVNEAITYLEKLGADNVVARSVIAVVGHQRRWPRAAAAAETQLTGRGPEIIRLPFSTVPLHNRRGSRAAVRLLAAVVARSG